MVTPRGWPHAARYEENQQTHHSGLRRLANPSLTQMADLETESLVQRFAKPMHGDPSRVAPCCQIRRKPADTPLWPPKTCQSKSHSEQATPNKKRQMANLETESLVQRFAKPMHGDPSRVAPCCQILTLWYKGLANKQCRLLFVCVSRCDEGPSF